MHLGLFFVGLLSGGTARRGAFRRRYMGYGAAIAAGARRLSPYTPFMNACTGHDADSARR
jgi:hypothetical protein